MGNENKDALSLKDHTRKQYLDYSMFVVKDRALPDIRDGLKPGQRRIIFSMNEMGKNHTSPHVKCARIVGDVLGKYHPHGDSAVYDAMVRLAQPFASRYPLVDGSGNFGSRDGDKAAAMRYTEARLTPIAQTLLDEVKLDTVDYKPNFDGTLKEPKVLPARIPFVLLNGISGIAVGMATEIPPHNFTEVANAALALIENADISDDEILSIVPAPDFPEGGQIISSATEIAETYKTGRGRVRVRPVWHKEDMADGEWKIVITQLPPNLSVEGVMESLEGMLNPKAPKGKKDINDKQKATKALLSKMIGGMMNESDLKSGMRLVIEPKSFKQDPDEMMKSVMINAGLETTVSINMVSIGLDGNPGQRSFKQMLGQWVDNRFTTVTRRTKFKLQKTLERIHILEGRIIAHLNIDDVIAIIRESDDPKPELMDRFKLSDIQAEDILEIKLRQLSRMDKIKLEGELSDKEADRDYLQGLLDNDDQMWGVIKTEITEDRDKFGDERRTMVEEAAALEVTPDALIVDEAISIAMSKSGWVKAKMGSHEGDDIAIKAGENAYFAVQTRTVNPLIVIDDKGVAYTIKPNEIPAGRGDGAHINTLIDMQGKKIVAMISGQQQEEFLIHTDAGYGYVATLTSMMSARKAGKAFLTVPDGAKVLEPIKVTDYDSEKVAIATTAGKVIVFSVNEIKRLPKGKGVKLLSFDEDAKTSATGISSSGFVISLKGLKEPFEITPDMIEDYTRARGGKGRFLPKKAVASQIICRD